ncbi:MAG: hypothetical protein ACE5LU_16785 [Anaerolineae bacterium]
MTKLASRLVTFLREGAPALLLTVGEDRYAHTAMTWAAARDSQTTRGDGGDGASCAG